MYVCVYIYIFFFFCINYVHGLCGSWRHPALPLRCDIWWGMAPIQQTVETQLAW